MTLEDYFQSYQNYFWEWENEVNTPASVFEAVAIPNAGTIAYEPHIIEILTYLAEESIPPFGSLLLALTATNPNARADLDKAFEDVKREFDSNNDTFTDFFVNVRQFLDNLSALPQEYKQGNKRRQLFQTIFSGCHNRLSADKARRILDQYKQSRQDLLRCGNKIKSSRSNFIKDFRTLEMLNAVFPDTASIIRKMAGLPPMPDVAEEVMEKPAITDKPSLVKELMLEAKTFPVGSLIKRLWSGLSIPMHHFASSSQPLGGISDLTNKGDFDKLLISEFANDDDVFMSRVANNEALYIEREVPPESDKFLRVILVDASLKNWGTPKVLSYASAIAIATHPKTDIECRIFALGESYAEVLYETVDGVITALDILSPKLDASNGLAAFLGSDIMALNPEIFMVSSAGALKMPAVQKVLADYPDTVKYCIEPDYEGNLMFYKIQNRSRKLIQRLYLPLEELWKDKPAEKAAPQLPKYVKPAGVPQYPILYPLRSTEIALFDLDNYIYILSTNKSLFRTYLHYDTDSRNRNDKYRGCELVLENLSIKSGGLHALGKEGDNYILMSLYLTEGIISYLNLNTKEYIKVPTKLEQHADYKIFYHQPKGLPGVFFLFNLSLGHFFTLAKEGKTLIISGTRRRHEINTGYEASVQKTVELGYRPGSSILQNYLPVCIDESDSLRLNKHRLTVYTHAQAQYSNINLLSNRDKAKINAVYNSNDDVNKFIFPDGSEVLRDKRGMLTLVSSNPGLPNIYIPAALNYALGVATDEEFAGNEYFYNYREGINQLKKISIADFDAKYLKPFVQNILDYAAQH